MFLSPTELVDLTDYKRPSKQMQWLAQNGIAYRTGATGRPKVLRSAVIDLLGGTVEPTPTEPDFGWMHNGAA